MRICILLFLSFFTLCKVNAQTTITGLVTDSMNNPLENVVVLDVANSSEYILTDKDGKYSIQLNKEGEHTLIFTYLLQKQRRKITVKPGARLLRLNIQFNILIQTGTVEILAEKGREIPGQIVVKPKSLEEFPSVGSFEQILKSVAPITATGGELSSSYSVRGGNFDENLVYVNGIEVYRPFLVRSGQQEGLSFINPDMIKSISFSAGGFQSKYGDKMSSVLDIDYKTPEEMEATARISFLGAQVHVGDRAFNDKLTYNVGIRYRDNSYLLNTLDVSGSYKPRFYDVQGFFTYKLGALWSVDWLTNYSSNRYILQPEQQQASFGTATQAFQLNVAFAGQELMNYTTFLNGLSFNYQPSRYNKYRFIISHYTTVEEELYTVEGAYNLSELDNNLGSENFGEAKALLGFGYFINNGRNELNAQVSNIAMRATNQLKNGMIEWGVKGQRELIDDRLKEWDYNDSSEYRLNESGNINETIQLDNYLKSQYVLASHRMMGYVQHSHYFKGEKGAKLNYGLRANWWDLNNETVVSPRLQFSFEPNKAFNDQLQISIQDRSLKEEINAKGLYDSMAKRDWLVKSAAGVYYQPPFYRELRDLKGNLNTNLKAQRSVHFLLGADLNFNAWGRPFKFYTEAYYKYLDRLIPYAIDNVRIRYTAQNQSKGYATGFDLRVNGEFVEGFESWFTLSFLHTQENITYTNNGVEVQSGFVRRPTDQRVNASILFRDALKTNPTYQVNLNLIFGSGIPYYFIEKQRSASDDINTIPAYRRVDIGFSKVFIDKENAPKKMWMKDIKYSVLALELFNILKVNNTISYIWVKDFSNNTYGVPSYLTGRRINLRWTIKI